MRRALIVATSLVGVMAVAAWSIRTTEASPRPPAVHTVTVGVSCTGTRVQVWVDPWTVNLPRGDEVEWVLDPNAGSQTLRIQPKHGGGWPFAGSPPAGGKGNPARTGQAQQAGRHQYDIVLSCERQGASPIPVILDPEIIIGN